MLLQWDDPLDAIAVHAWNGSWGVIATGLLAGKGLVLQSYGSNPEYTGDFVIAGDQSNLSEAPDAWFRQWGCFLGGNGRLLGCQIIYLMWLCGMRMHSVFPALLACVRVCVHTALSSCQCDPQRPCCAVSSPHCMLLLVL